jgi:hypothetical protein
VAGHAANSVAANAGGLYASAHVDRTVRAWDPRQGSMVRASLASHKGWVSAGLCFLLPCVSSLSLLPSSCLVPLSCRHTHVYCVCVCMCVRAHTTSGRQGFLLKLWVFVQCALHIRTCIGGHSRCSKWGRSALSCAFSMRMLFVPLPNSKPSAEGRTEHPRVT